MNRLQNILVGIDFTPPSATALAQAVRIAAWNGSALHAIHVIEILVVSELELALSPFQQNIQAGLVRDAHAEWERFAPGLDKSHARFDVAIGTPLAEIVAKARATHAGLLIMGVYGAGGPTRGTGTLATQCVRKAPTRVLLVQENQAGPFKRVVACVDFSETSLHAVEHAARMAAQDDAALHILHVYDAPWQRYHYRAPTPQATPDFQKQYADSLLGRLRAFCEPLQHELNYLKPTYDLHENRSHGVGISEFVRKVDADLVVLGTRGRTNFRDILLGSTAERVVRDAACSILTIPPKE